MINKQASPSLLSMSSSQETLFLLAWLTAPWHLSTLSLRVNCARIGLKLATADTTKIASLLMVHMNWSVLTRRTLKLRSRTIRHRNVVNFGKRCSANTERDATSVMSKEPSLSCINTFTVSIYLLLNVSNLSTWLRLKNIPTIIEPPKISSYLVTDQDSQCSETST